MITHLTQRINLYLNCHGQSAVYKQFDLQNQLEAIQIPQTFNTQNDFIKKFHFNSLSVLISQTFKSLDNGQKQFMALYQNQFKLKVGSVNIKDQDFYSSENYQGQIVIQKKDSASLALNKDLRFETVPYDAQFLTTSAYQDQSLNMIVSNKSMPVRIYQLNNDGSKQQSYNSLTYCTFNEHKQNSQAFLSPYQFSVKGKKVVGAGRKFMSIYDCQKIQSSRVKAFDRIHLSTVELLSDENTVLIGDFVGNVYQIDLRQENKTISQPMKPHVDAVFHVKSFHSNQNMFLSSARKDNFTYLFDRRNLSTFVSYFEFQRHSNQRYGIATNHNIFAIGLQDGTIYMNTISSQLGQIPQNGKLFQDPSFVNVTDLKIQNTGSAKAKVFYSVGTRFYQQIQDKEQTQNTQQDTVQNFGLRCFVQSIPT